MARQWKRVVQVIVGKAGKGVVIETLRVKFEVEKTLDPEPNRAVIDIYNLTPENEAKIKKEYDEIIINAGYKDEVKMIFRGNIMFASSYRDKTDRITRVTAGDGDYDYRNAVINETLAAGASEEQLIDRALKTFTGIEKGHITVTGSGRRRGKVLTGATRDILSKVARESNAHWSIQDGALVMVGVDETLPDEAIILNSLSGLLESPEINDKGIALKCLLNPNMRINGTLKLDNAGIKQQHIRARALASPREKKEALKEPPVELDPNGLYKIIKLTHVGDNRGPEWTTTPECIGINQSIPASRS